MNAIRYRVSSDYFNYHEEWWYDTEEAARRKRSELLATLSARWDVRLDVFNVGQDNG